MRTDLHFFIKSRSILLKIENIPDKITGKIDVPKFFFRKCAVYEIKCKIW